VDSKEELVLKSARIYGTIQLRKLSAIQLPWGTGMRIGNSWDHSGKNCRHDTAKPKKKEKGT